MLEVNSYIKIPLIELPDDFEQEPNKFFIHIDDKERIKKYINQIDDGYLEGALILSYQNSPILTFELWDLIGELWAYFLNAIEGFLLSSAAEFYYPDQPIKIELSKFKEDYIKLIVGEGKYGMFFLPKLELLQSLVDEAEHFFEKFDEYFTPNQYKFHVDQLAKLKSTLKSTYQ